MPSHGEDRTIEEVCEIAACEIHSYPLELAKHAL